MKVLKFKIAQQEYIVLLIDFYKKIVKYIKTKVKPLAKKF